jgi:hypothetical protein
MPTKDAIDEKQILDAIRAMRLNNERRIKFLVNACWEFKTQRDARIIELTDIKTGDVENLLYEMTDEEEKLNREFVNFLMDENL